MAARVIQCTVCTVCVCVCTLFVCSYISKPSIRLEINTKFKLEIKRLNPKTTVDADSQ